MPHFLPSPDNIRQEEMCSCQRMSFSCGHSQLLVSPVCSLDDHRPRAEHNLIWDKKSCTEAHETAYFVMPLCPPKGVENASIPQWKLAYVEGAPCLAVVQEFAGCIDDRPPSRGESQVRFLLPYSGNVEWHTDSLDDDEASRNEIAYEETTRRYNAACRAIDNLSCQRRERIFEIDLAIHCLKEQVRLG